MTSRLRVRLVVAAVLVVGALAGLAVFAPSLLPTGDGEFDRDAARAATVQRINEFRTGRGRPALTAAPRLDEVARTRSGGGEARANCSGTVLTATVRSPPDDEARFAGLLVESLTENDAARERLLRRNATAVGVGFDAREEAVRAAVVLC
ncbi:MAG: hypothetical protein V5A31_13935 [Haloferacaceae archaeon]